MIISDDNQKTWSEGVEHPDEDLLLCFIDGELSPESTEGVRFHLEECWHCRLRAEKLQGAISLFVDFDGQVLQPNLEPPNSWGGFHSRLERNAVAPIPTTAWQRWIGFLGRLRSRLPNVQPRTLRLATITAVILLVGLAGAYLLLNSSTRVVSAEELIDRIAASRAAELATTSQPVLYQQLRIRSSRLRPETSAEVAIWQDVGNLRLRAVLEPQTGKRDTQVWQELESILRQNHYEPPLLSITSFRTWRNALAQKEESVTELKTEDGTAALKLRTMAVGNRSTGQIILSDLIVRAGDYHPVSQEFRIAMANGEEVFEIRESSFAVMSLNTLGSGFFADAMSMTAMARPLPREMVLASGTTTANTNLNVNAEPPAGIATAALEVQVIDLLNPVNAFMGDQVTVQRKQDGKIEVSGLVDTNQRKAELLNALGPVRTNPALRISIQTIAEVQDRQARSTKGTETPSAITVERYEATENTNPVYQDLRKKFTDDEARRFVDRILGWSHAARRHAFAAKQLSARFSTTDVASLSAPERERWLRLIRGHTAAVAGDLESVRRDLQMVFPDLGGGAGRRAFVSDMEIQAAVRELFDLTNACDDDLSRSLAVSAGGGGSPQVKTGKFWQMLNAAISLGRSFEAAK